jgi:hypothetical protein
VSPLAALTAPIDDEAALEITESFYGHWRRERTLDIGGAARALHRATSKPKDAQDYPERTVPTVQPATPAASAGLRSIS